MGIDAALVGFTSKKSHQSCGSIAKIVLAVVETPCMSPTCTVDFNLRVSASELVLVVEFSVQKMRVTLARITALPTVSPTTQVVVESLMPQ